MDTLIGHTQVQSLPDVAHQSHLQQVIKHQKHGLSVPQFKKKIKNKKGHIGYSQCVEKKQDELVM